MMEDIRKLAKSMLSTDGKTLSLGEMRYTNKIHADAILYAIRHTPQLERVALDNLHLATQWMTPVLDALADCRQLRHVSLSGNSLSGHNAGRLVQAVRQWPQLQELALDRTELDAQNFPALCDALKQCPTLYRFSCSGNPLGAQGAKATTLLPYLPRLRHLVLEDCRMPDAAVTRMADAVAEHGQNLVTCSLHYNAATENSAAYFTRRIAEAGLKNLISSPLNYDPLREYCGEQLNRVNHLAHWLVPTQGATLEATLDALPAPILAQMENRLAALTETQPPATMQSLHALLDSLPAYNPAVPHSLTQKDSRGYCALDNPRTWQRIAEWQPFPDKDILLGAGRNCESLAIIGLAQDAKTVIPMLNAKGIGITNTTLCTPRGEPSPVLRQLIEDGTAPLLFTAANWRGKTPQDMHAVYEQLPEEQRRQVTNYYALRTQLDTQHQPQKGRGR